ncbi:MAG: fibronectin type III domain-containing protein [Candidatus Kapaibacterium sp.]
MKFKHLLMSGLIMAFAGMFAVGCNENPVDNPDPDPTTVEPATGLQALSKNGAVMLQWTASTTTGVTYTVEYNEKGSTDKTTLTDATSPLEVTSLTNGTIYEFSVTAVKGTESSTAATIEWAPADRYTTDTDPGSAVLRIYEKSAPTGKGSGLIIDPTKGGPSNESVANGVIGNIQLVADVQGNQILIGPGNAPEFDGVFSNWGNFDNNVQVSDNFEPTSGLNAWYLDSKLGDLFTTSRKSAYTIANQQSGNQGVAFAFRLGTAGNFRYGKVFIVPGTNGQLVQNDGNNYIVLQISLQQPNVPYAK